VDLLCGIPDQSEVDLREAIEAFTSFPIDHLSVYLLTLPPKHFLSSRLPEESVQSRHLEVVHEEMLSRGFLHYEISNFAKPGGEARHNLNYWHGGSCLGLGPSAHSFEASQGVRWKNFSSLHSYAQAFELASTASQPPWNERVQEYEKLTAQQRELEKWMLQLRLAEGFPLTWCTDIQLNRARILVRDGLLEAHPERLHTLRPTLRGMILSESVIEFLVG
jgi:oxygen-independent coproporphyrinogen-3 oxidase